MREWTDEGRASKVTGLKEDIHLGTSHLQGALWAIDKD